VFDDDLVLPDKGVLLHVGPHKTGTTAIQGAFFQARAELAKIGVIYPGKGRQHQMPALALTGGTGLRGDREATMADWDRLVGFVRDAADQRVVVSSEFFDECTDEMAQKVVDDFGADRVHVVVTLRPIAKILPSAWQQYVRNGLRRTYDEFLDGMLRKPPYDSPSPSFWRRHHHDQIVERWVKTVGPDRVVAVVLDERNPDSLMRTFEGFLSLPTGMLAPETGWENRSLTAAETELVRLINAEYHAKKWAPTIYNNVVRLGMIKGIQRRAPGRDEPGIVTPNWAVERANEIAAEAAERIRSSGARIVGDLAWLSAVTPKDTGEPAPLLPVDAASEAVIGAIAGSGILARKPPAPKKAADLNKKLPIAKPVRGIDDYKTRELVEVIRGRLAAKYGRKGK
jgi:hypothetical protein